MKTLTYCIMHFTVAFCVSYVITGDVSIAGALAIIEPAIQTVAYFFHEKAWAKKILRDKERANMVPQNQEIAQVG